MSPAVSIKDILVAANVAEFPAAGASGWALAIGIITASAATSQQISIADTGGLDPNPKWLLDFPTVQLMVRGAPGAYVEAHAKAKQIKDVLLGIGTTDAGANSIDSITMQGDINLVGYDEKARPMFSLNFRMILEPEITAESNRQAI